MVVKWAYTLNTKKISKQLEFQENFMLKNVVVAFFLTRLKNEKIAIRFW